MDTKIFVGGIPQTMTHEELFDIFSQHGPIRSAWLQKVRKNHTAPSMIHRGFGFIDFYYAFSVWHLLHDSDSRYIRVNDSLLEVKIAVPKKSKTNSKSVVTSQYLKYHNPVKLQQGEQGEVQLLSSMNYSHLCF